MPMTGRGRRKLRDAPTDRWRSVADWPLRIHLTTRLPEGIVTARLGPAVRIPPRAGLGQAIGHERQQHPPLLRPPRPPARPFHRSRRRCPAGLRTPRTRPLPLHPAPGREADRQGTPQAVRHIRRSPGRAASAPPRGRGHRRERRHGPQDRRGLGPAARQGSGRQTSGAVLLVGGAGLLPHHNGFRGCRAVPPALPRQAQRAHRRRGAAIRNGRSHPGLPPARW